MGLIETVYYLIILKKIVDYLVTYIYLKKIVD
jgi:hypothetical protein